MRRQVVLLRHRCAICPESTATKATVNEREMQRNSMQWAPTVWYVLEQMKNIWHNAMNEIPNERCNDWIKLHTSSQRSETDLWKKQQKTETKWGKSASGHQKHTQHSRDEWNTEWKVTIESNFTTAANEVRRQLLKKAEKKRWNEERTSETHSNIQNELPYQRRSAWDSD
jgi:hypothetical protein